MKFNHALSDVLDRGLVEMDVPPSRDIPTLAEVQRSKIHAYYRLTDGLWHRFRYSDPVVAAQRDAELCGSLMR